MRPKLGAPEDGCCCTFEGEPVIKGPLRRFRFACPKGMLAHVARLACMSPVCDWNGLGPGRHGKRTKFGRCDMITCPTLKSFGHLDQPVESRDQIYPLDSNNKVAISLPRRAHEATSLHSLACVPSVFWRWRAEAL